MPNGMRIVRGAEETTKVIIETVARAGKTIRNYADPSSIALAFQFNIFYRLYLDARARAVKILTITEIRQNNLRYCKRMMGELSVEMRHMERVKGSFSTGDIEYLATSVIS